jgi:hypothetical protein
MRSWGLPPGRSRIVFGPGTLGRTWGTRPVLIGVFYGSCSDGMDLGLLCWLIYWLVDDHVFVDLGVFQSGAG